MKKNTTRKAKKIVITVLLVFFGIQQSALSVWATPGDVLDGTIEAIYNASPLAGQTIPSGSTIDIAVTLDMEDDPDQGFVASSNLIPFLTDAMGNELPATFTIVAGQEGGFSLTLDPALTTGNYQLILGNTVAQPFAQGQILFSVINTQAGGAAIPVAQPETIFVVDGYATTPNLTGQLELTVNSQIEINTFLFLSTSTDFQKTYLEPYGSTLIIEDTNPDTPMIDALSTGLLIKNPNTIDGEYLLTIDTTFSIGETYTLTVVNELLQPLEENLNNQITFTVVEPSLLHAQFGTKDQLRIATNSPVYIPLRAFYSDKPTTAIDLAKSSDVSFLLTNTLGINVDPSLYTISFLSNTAFVISITQSESYTLMLLDASGSIMFDTQDISVVPQITDMNVLIQTNPVALDSYLIFTTQYLFEEANTLTNTSLDSVYPHIYKKIGENMYELAIDSVANLNTNGVYAAKMNTDLNGVELSPGTYAIAALSYTLEGDFEPISNATGLTFYEFELVEEEAIPDDPQKTFSALTRDTNHNGHLDHILVTFPDNINKNTTVVPLMEVDGYIVSAEAWVHEDAEGNTKTLLLEISKEDILDTNALCDNTMPGNTCETGLTPMVTLTSSFQQIGLKNVIPADGANPIIYSFDSGAIPGEQFYNQSNPKFSESIQVGTIPSSAFGATCPILENCIFVLYNTTFSTNTFSIAPMPESDTQLQFIFGDQSKYSFAESGMTLPKLLITYDGLVLDQAGNPLLAHPINTILLDSTANLNAIEQDSSFDITSYVEYLGMPVSAMNLPSDISLIVSSTIEDSTIVSKGNGVYTISIPTSTATGTYELMLDTDSITSNKLAFTVIEKQTILDEPAQKSPPENLGGSGGGGGGGSIPINHAPHAVIKEILTSISSGTAMTVDGTLSNDPDNDPLFFSWNFGDGTSTELSTLDAILSHIYTTPGAYTITLKVQDSNHASDTASIMVTVLTEKELVEDKIPQTSTTTVDTNIPTQTNTIIEIPINNTQTNNQIKQSTLQEENTDETLENKADTSEEIIEESPNKALEPARITTTTLETPEGAVPPWLTWLFGSTTVVAAVWTGILANRYRKYVA
ncbi:MAG: PKD domain-containing protein [Candidatus Magasanikbacteria bacterium]|nr:PKD domain-containing protein [Candidatus Magasanikbacteria bacterium]